jgi:hypothetical protein
MKNTPNPNNALVRGSQHPLVVPLEIPASEGYPAGWMHCKIHLNPETGEMHSDGDHRVRHWIEERIPKTPKTFRERVTAAWKILRHNAKSAATGSERNENE